VSLSPPVPRNVRVARHSPHDVHSAVADQQRAPGDFFPLAARSPDPLSPARILEVGFGFWSSKVLLTAVELGVFTALGARSMTGEALGKALGLHPRGTYDFLDALVSLGFLERAGDGERGRYRNSPSAEHYLDRNKPTYIGGILEMLNARLYGYWNELGEALRTGRPQNEVKRTGRPLFEALYADPERLEQFMSAMHGISAANFTALAGKFDFSRYQTLCDVGGATGLLSIEVARRHPHMRCISFDLPRVEPIAQRWIANARMQHRVTTRSGDFLHDSLPRADVITMGMILHDWDLQTKKHLVRLAYEALPPGGAFIAIENLIDDARRENTFGLLMSLNMLIEFGDAFDFTGADFWSWCREAGFSRYEVIHLSGPCSAAIAYK
jgi:predicted O-methyltransferase YrrM